MEFRREELPAQRQGATCANPARYCSSQTGRPQAACMAACAWRPPAGRCSRGDVVFVAALSEPSIGTTAEPGEYSQRFSKRQAKNIRGPWVRYAKRRGRRDAEVAEKRQIDLEGSSSVSSVFSVGESFSASSASLRPPCLTPHGFQQIARAQTHCPRNRYTRSYGTARAFGMIRLCRLFGAQVTPARGR